MPHTDHEHCYWALLARGELHFHRAMLLASHSSLLLLSPHTTALVEPLLRYTRVVCVCHIRVAWRWS